MTLASNPCTGGRFCAPKVVSLEGGRMDGWWASVEKNRDERHAEAVDTLFVVPADPPSEPLLTLGSGFTFSEGSPVKVLYFVCKSCERIKSVTVSESYIVYRRDGKKFLVEKTKV